MVSTNPMFRNTPTNQERNKMRNSGMDLNAVRDITGRTSDFRTPNARFNPLDRAGQLQRGAADDYAAERMAGGTGAAPMDRVNQLQPLAFAEDNTTFVDGKAYSRGLGEGSPQPTAQPGGYRARMAPKEPDPFAPGAGYQATDPSDPYYSKTPRRPMRLAEGGPVEGPGGPKDDLINAKLSDGEFVMPAEVVEFYGLDRLHKMMAKAKEGLNEIKPAPQALPTPLPVTMPQPTPAFAYGGMATRDSLPGYKLGGQFAEEERPTDGSPKQADYQSDPEIASAYQIDPNLANVKWNLYEAIQANARAQYDNTGPIAMMGLGIGPRGDAGIASSQAASSATQQTNDRLGSFFEAEAAKTAADRERMAEARQRQDAMMNYAPGSPAPRPAPSPLPEFLGRAAPLFPQGRPVSPSPAAPMTFDPAAVAAMRSRRADLRSQPAMPAMANGRQPQPVLSSPMDVPLMRPAPLTMTEREQQAKPISRSRTPESNPEFEAALAGLTGMQKRRARAGLQMEEATNQRNQARAAIEQANIDARDAAKQADADRRAAAATAAAQEWWKQQQQIGQNFDMARENRNINNAAALNAAEQARADQRALMEAQQKAQADAAARQISMQPIPGTPGYNVAMMGGSRVPGTPLMQAQTTPGPFREGLGRTTYTPMEDPATAPKPPTVRKSAPRPGATKEAPEWEYATMSDLSTRPITIENPRPDQMSERFKHQYGKAPQTEADWTDAYYLTTGQPRPKTTAAAAPAAGTAAPRAKIKAVTPVS